MRQFRLNAALTVAAVSVALPACKKDGGTTADSVVSAAENETKPTSVDAAKVLAASNELIIAGQLVLLPGKSTDKASLRLMDSDTDLAKHKTSVRTNERSTEPAKKAGAIMCFLEKTKFSDFANQGEYVAMVDEEACFEKDGGGDSAQGQSKQEKLRRVRVNSVHEEGKPLVASFSIDPSEDDSKSIRARVAVAEGPSESNPLGIFRMQWSEEGGGGGLIETSRNEEGAIQLVFKDVWSREEEGRSYGGKSLAAVEVEIKDDEVVGGRLSTYSEEPDWSNRGEGQSIKNYKVAFNEDYLRSVETTEGEVCKSRNDFIGMAHNYSLYEKATGKLASIGELGSGMEVAFEVDGKPMRGHASYWGIWPAEKFSHGQAVKGIKYADGKPSESDYTIVTAPGKLVRYTARKTKVGALKGMELSYHDNGSNYRVKYRVKYDGTNFVKLEKVMHGQDGETTEPASGNVEPMWGRFNFYVPAFQANVDIPADATAATELRYFSGEVVSDNPSKQPSGELLCFSNCPKVQPTAEDLKDRSGPYYGTTKNGRKNTNSQNLLTAMATYTFNSSSLNIEQNGVAFQLPQIQSNGRDSQGVWIGSGALVQAAEVASITDRANKGGWEIEREIETFYRWESGSSEWSKFTGLKDSSGKMVRFDRPLEISYTHSTANDLNGSSDFDGKPARLNYGGNGQLWGIPGKKNEEFGYYIPLFGLKNGTELEDGKYVVMANQIDQFLRKTDADKCADLSLDEIPELPSEELPEFASYDFASDAPPTKVIKGEKVK